MTIWESEKIKPEISAHGKYISKDNMEQLIAQINSFVRRVI